MSDNTQPERELQNGSLVVINVGIDLFYQSLEAQNVEVLQVDWKPSPVIEPEVNKLLDQLL